MRIKMNGSSMTGLRSSICGLVATAAVLLGTGASAAPREEALGYFGQIMSVSDGDGLEVYINGSKASEVELGNDVVFSFRSARAAYLTAIYLDGHGVATVLYPTRNPEDALLKPGELKRFPPEASFEASLPLGLESLLVVTTPKPLPREFFVVNAGSDELPVLDAELAPKVTRNLLAIAEGFPAGSVAAASASQVVRAPSAPAGPQYRALEIEKHFTNRTRALRRPKLDLDIHFGFNDATLSEDARVNLDEVGKALNSDRLASVTFEFEGHTDDVGPDSFNMELSKRRALAARDYLREQHGIDPERLLTVGYGESRPLMPGTSEADRAMNRRVTLTMHPPPTRGGYPSVPDVDSLDVRELLAGD